MDANDTNETRIHPFSLPLSFFFHSFFLSLHHPFPFVFPSPLFIISLSLCPHPDKKIWYGMDHSWLVLSGEGKKELEKPQMVCPQDTRGTRRERRTDASLNISCIHFQLTATTHPFSFPPLLLVIFVLELELYEKILLRNRKRITVTMINTPKTVAGRLNKLLSLSFYQNFSLLFYSFLSGRFKGTDGVLVTRSSWEDRINCQSLSSSILLLLQRDIKMRKFLETTDSLNLVCFVTHFRTNTIFKKNLQCLDTKRVKCVTKSTHWIKCITFSRTCTLSLDTSEHYFQWDCNSWLSGQGTRIIKSFSSTHLKSSHLDWKESSTRRHLNSVINKDLDHKELQVMKGSKTKVRKLIPLINPNGQLTCYQDFVWKLFSPYFKKNKCTTEIVNWNRNWSVLFWIQFP